MDWCQDLQQNDTSWAAPFSQVIQGVLLGFRLAFLGSGVRATVL